MGDWADDTTQRRRRLSPLYKRLEAKYGDDQHEFDDVLAQTGFYSMKHGGKFDASFNKAYDEAMGLEYSDMEANLDLDEDDSPGAAVARKSRRKKSSSRSSSSRTPVTRKEKRAANRAAWRAGKRW